MSDYDLPEEVYAVRPRHDGMKNLYESMRSLKLALAYRGRSGYRRSNPAKRIYRARIEWVDVTDEFVKVDGEDAGQGNAVAA